MASRNTKRVKKKQNRWFIPLRGSYLPASPAGWLTYVPYIAYLAFTGYASFQATTETQTALLIMIPNWIAATAVLTWVAKRTS